MVDVLIVGAGGREHAIYKLKYVHRNKSYTNKIHIIQNYVSKRNI